MNRLCRFIFLALSLMPVRAWAQDMDPEPRAGQEKTGNAADETYSFEPAYKFIFGTNRYRNNDLSLTVNMPHGFSMDADYDSYRSDISSTTRSISLGADQSLDRFAFGANYSLEPLHDGARSHALDINASFHTDSRDFRTTLSADLGVTENFQRIEFSTVTKNLEITQKAAKIGIKQKFFGARAGVELTGYGYNHNIRSFSLSVARLEAEFNKKHPRLYSRISGNVEGVNGLLTGFPDWSAKFSLYQDIDFLPLPVTLWGKHEHTHFLAAYEYRPPALPIDSLVSGVTSDSVTVGADADLSGQVTGTLQYNHVRETGQGGQDLYGIGLSATF